jgi:hypothetical protein
VKVPSLTLFVAAVVLLPVQADAQLAKAVDAPPTMHSSAVPSMRPSMAARYATVPQVVNGTPLAMPIPRMLVRQLAGAAVTAVAVLSRVHPLLPTGVRMVRHDH